MKTTNNKTIKLREHAKKTIPVVFATDDNYAPFLVVAIHSMVQHISPSNMYRVYILQTNISDKHKSMINKYQRDNVTIQFINVAEKLDALSSKLYLRDYYTNAIYYRVFIPSLLPNFKKAVYLDCDLVILDDVAKLYNQNIKDNIFGVVADDVVAAMPVFGEYAEKMVGVSRYKYFNSGVLVMNLEKLRTYNIEEKFVNLLTQFKFIIAPDQDLFNAICKDKVTYLDAGWNKCSLKQESFDDSTLKIAHYKMALKPWKSKGILYEEPFWEYAQHTEVYNLMLQMLESYTAEDHQNDALSLERLKAQAIADSNNPNNYYNTLKRHQEYHGRTIDLFYEKYDFSTPLKPEIKEEQPAFSLSLNELMDADTQKA